MQQLWIVRIVHEGYVLADSEVDALNAAGSIHRNEPTTATALRWVCEELEGWTDDFLVYGRVERETTLGEAKVMHLEHAARPDDTR